MFVKIPSTERTKHVSQLPQITMSNISKNTIAVINSMMNNNLKTTPTHKGNSIRVSLFYNGQANIKCLACH
jgi:hypothetical protein